MNKNNLLLYSGILIFGIAAPFLFPAFKVQLSILCVLIVLATTWNIQGGEMGYNSFGNILFYGLGMYLCASVQVGMFFPLAEWTESGGEKTFQLERRHTDTFQVHKIKYYQKNYSPFHHLEYSTWSLKLLKHKELIVVL